MRVAIISDIHDNLVNLEKCLAWCRQEGVSALLCCGDVTNDETLKYLTESFSGTIHLVQGNMEIYPENETGRYRNIIDYGRVGRFEIDGRRIGICHEPFLIDQVLELGECDFIFYGHTHKPWINPRGGVKLVNPGTLGGVFQKATFAVWDTEKEEPELKILENL